MISLYEQRLFMRSCTYRQRIIRERVDPVK